MTTNKFFIQVNHATFRRYINLTANTRIRRTGYETIIYDGNGDVLGIMHSASIDEKGRCHEPAYYLNRTAEVLAQPASQLRLVA